MYDGEPNGEDAHRCYGILGHSKKII